MIHRILLMILRFAGRRSNISAVFAARKHHRLRGAGWIMSLQARDMDGAGDLDVLRCEERAGLGVVWYENPR